MKAYLLTLAAVLALSPGALQAQVHVGIELGLPRIPQLVVVAPGVQVVEGFQDEVFLSGGWYWCRRGDGWYRSRSPQAHFGWVDEGRVPGGLRRMPVGRYQNWHHDRDGHEGGRGRDFGHERGHEDHRGEQGRGHEEGRGHEGGRGHEEGHHEK